MEFEAEVASARSFPLAASLAAFSKAIMRRSRVATRWRSRVRAVVRAIVSEADEAVAAKEEEDEEEDDDDEEDEELLSPALKALLCLESAPPLDCLLAAKSSMSAVVDADGTARISTGVSLDAELDAVADDDILAALVDIAFSPLEEGADAAVIATAAAGEEEAADKADAVIC